MIRLSKVTSGFGHLTILRDIDLVLDVGEMVLVLGANGAGKTTLLRTISGLAQVRSGSITFDGQDITGAQPHRLARSGLVHVPQGRQIVPHLTVEENLLIGAQHVPGITARLMTERLEAEYARFPVLKERRHVPGGSLSGGEQQMLAVSRGLMMGPRVLMLDEPSLGLAPQAIHRILVAVEALARQGMSVLMVEQKTSALRFAQRALVLRNGEIVFSGQAKGLSADDELMRHYGGAG
ncbi:MAG: ABC transporter ATP-binding protein [Hyphomicrobiales bacterium]|nr:MAG: ABC transporter ATP-binding protein [Hyphomicrobiales bacterium]